MTFSAAGNLTIDSDYKSLEISETKFNQLKINSTRTNNNLQNMRN